MQVHPRTQCNPRRKRLDLSDFNCLQFCLNFAFNANLRHFIQGAPTVASPYPEMNLDTDPRLLSGCFVAQQLLSMAVDLQA